MRLQRVEMAGYKSFGARTELRFDAPVTAIVGPNGSGKSNVVDALRWVIGESANRNLRVRRLDEVIFSGGRSRAPSGFAEVLIALDNSGRWLDLDAAEVEVLRRVHRDGESEFRINGRSVRMRDVQDLFRSAGLSTDGYAMIGQGAVDEMLRMRPADRRRLIEEVADVRRHRRRIDDSRRQRRRAADHLSQARVVRDELAPRVRSLGRRAQRARQYDELMAQLGDALRAYYRVQDAALRRELEQRRADAARAGAERRQTEAGAAEARRDLEAADAAVADARREADAAARARATAERALSDLRNQQRLDAREIEWRAREHRDAAAELESLPPASDGDPRAALRAAEQDLAAADAALADARAALRRAEEAAAAATRSRFEMLALRAELVDVTARWLSERAAADDLERARNAAAVAVVLAESAFDEAGANCDERRATAASARAEAGEISERRRALEARRDDLAVRIAEIEAVDAGADSVELRALLSVAPEWQAAVDAALGELGGAEISGTLDRAMDSAAEAVERDAGRRLFVAPALQRRAPAGGSRSVAQLVDAPAELREVVEALLGDIAVSDTAEAAIAAVRGGARMAVTRDGLAVRADGVVGGGRGAPGARRRERQAAAWRAETDEVSRELSSLPPDEKRAGDVAAADDDLRKAEEARDAAAAQLARTRGTAREVADRAAESATVLRGLDADARRVGGHLLRAYEAIAAVGAGAGGAVSIAELERRRDDASAALSTARAVFESSDRRRRVEGRIADAGRRLGELEHASKARAREISRAEADLTRIPQPDALAEHVAGAETVQADARQSLDAAQQERVAAERAAADADSRAREAGAALARLAQDAEADGIRLAELPADDGTAGESGQLRGEVQRLRDRIHRLGPVDASAAREHREEQERLEHLDAEIADLEATELKLAEAEADLERVMRTRFEAAFRDVNAAFARNFQVMFRGGTAQLSLDRAQDDEGDAEPGELPEPGIVIDAQPPGKRLAGLSLLSGGERALTAIALLFALLEMRPSPFCVLDEVDAALDEANVERFIRAVKDRAGETQFIVITHNRRTIEQADAIYGVTMGAEAYSRVVSVRLTGETAAAANANGSSAALGNGARAAQPAGRVG